MSLTKNIFEHVLVEPAKRGGKKLFIVSGYATPAMAFHHQSILKTNNLDVNVELIVGMCIQDGLGQSRHLGFKHLVEDELKDTFKCSYLVKSPAVHSKVYVWSDGENLITAFAGSANYTQSAFKGGLREYMVECDPNTGFAYFRNLISETIYCEHPDAEQEIIIYNDKLSERIQNRRRVNEELSTISTESELAIEGLPHVHVSLLDRNGNLPPRSGLNWGQRPEYHRDPNQAYIRLPSDIYSGDFFPPRGEHFTIITDDRKILICTRAQDSAKAIECPQNNSLIGIYFRGRLGLNSGQIVMKDDLMRYGKTYIDFYKLDEETYYMDFSQVSNPIN